MLGVYSMLQCKEILLLLDKIWIVFYVERAMLSAVFI